MTKILTFIGFVVGLALMALSINYMSSNMFIYYNLPSVGIIFGGLIVSMFVSYRSIGVMYLIRTVYEVLLRDVPLPKYIAIDFTEYAKIIAKEGFVGLEKEIDKIDKNNILLKSALEMLIAGYSKEDIKYIIENHAIENMDRLRDNVKLLKNLASYAPAFGMIGTVVGLIAMLHNMGGDISTIGPSMSVALITTLYGAALNMLMFTPLAEKTRRQLELLKVNYNIIIDGVVYLHEKRNYVFMRDALNAHLLPKYEMKSDAE